MSVRRPSEWCAPPGSGGRWSRRHCLRQGLHAVGLALAPSAWSASVQALPSLVAMERRWTSALVQVFVDERQVHQGFFIRSNGWLLTHFPQVKPAQQVVVELADGARRRGQVLRRGVSGVALVRLHTLPGDVPVVSPPLATSFASTMARSTASPWLVGLSRHPHKGHVFAAMGGVGRRGAARRLWLLDLPLHPGAPVFVDGEVVAVVVHKDNAQQVRAVPIEQVRRWLPSEGEVGGQKGVGQGVGAGDSNRSDCSNTSARSATGSSACASTVRPANKRSD